MPDTQDKLIDAFPTKELFIFMLTKDIPLSRSIIDLIDNSVDGARRLRADKDFTGLWVNITATPLEFIIEDNCGGIPTDTARDYAFRFGRPKNMPTTPSSIGQFGVGMKRAFFKLGLAFEVESATDTTYFEVKEHVQSWTDRGDRDWSFEFKQLIEDPNQIPGNKKQRTRIVVAPLHESVAVEFGLENFQTRLRHEIAVAHQSSLNSGLVITLNNNPVRSESVEILAAPEKLLPAYRKMTFTEPGKQSATAEVWAGIYKSNGRSSPSAAGWYVYCNGRLVLEADQTRTSGWGEGGVETSIPRFHNQFAMFRGYVFFDCLDAGRLPWNTTKTGVDADSPMYQAVRLQMIAVMRSVIDFLNDLDEANTVGGGDSALQQLVDSAQKYKVSQAPTAEVFSADTSKVAPQGSRQVNIRYQRPHAEVEWVKEALGVSTPKEVGERTFQYFFKRECES